MWIAEAGEVQTRKEAVVHRDDVLSLIVAARILGRWRKQLK
jgi:hypothetical protein